LVKQFFQAPFDLFPGERRLTRDLHENERIATSTPPRLASRIIVRRSVTRPPGERDRAAFEGVSRRREIGTPR
jgi:hypothetical protein